MSGKRAGNAGCARPWPVVARVGRKQPRQGRCLAELHRPSISANHSSAAKTARLKPRVPATVSDPPAAWTNTSPNRRQNPGAG
jgi:hypothetical protein